MLIRKAERKQAKLRLGLCGVSGSGKTLGAINIAQGMGGKFVVIDTEDTSADLYSDVADYDVLNLQAPFSPERYIQAIKACEKAGYQTIIIDSLSHAWAGTGGILDMQDIATKSSQKQNSYFAWREVTPWHNKLVDAILQSSAHVIICMRSKVHYDVINVNGKQTPTKVGLAPIQREGLDYEFTCVLDIDQKTHYYSASKDRTRLFDGKNGLISPETGEQLMTWLNSGKSSQEANKETLIEVQKLFDDKDSLDDLRNDFMEMIKLHPTLSKEITEAKDKRKNELSVDGRLAAIIEKTNGYANGATAGAH